MWRCTPNLGVRHVQEKPHKHSHVSQRKDVPLQQAVETGSAVPLVCCDILYLAKCGSDSNLHFLIGLWGGHFTDYKKVRCFYLDLYITKCLPNQIWKVQSMYKCSKYAFFQRADLIEVYDRMTVLLLHWTCFHVSFNKECLLGYLVIYSLLTHLLHVFILELYPLHSMFFYFIKPKN